MVDETERPLTIAQRDAPLPRWATITLPFASAGAYSPSTLAM